MALGAIPMFTAGNVAIVEFNLNTREEQLTMRIKIFATKIKNWIRIVRSQSQSMYRSCSFDRLYSILFDLIWFGQFWSSLHFSSLWCACIRSNKKILELDPIHFFKSEAVINYRVMQMYPEWPRLRRIVDKNCIFHRRSFNYAPKKSQQSLQTS